MTCAFSYVFMTLGTFGIVAALGKRGEQLGGLSGPRCAAARNRNAHAAVSDVVERHSADGQITAKFGVILSAVRAGFTLSCKASIPIPRELAASISSRHHAEPSRTRGC